MELFNYGHNLWYWNSSVFSLELWMMKMSMHSGSKQDRYWIHNVMFLFEQISSSWIQLVRFQCWIVPFQSCMCDIILHRWSSIWLLCVRFYGIYSLEFRLCYSIDNDSSQPAYGYSVTGWSKQNKYWSIKDQVRVSQILQYGYLDQCS